MNWATLLKLSVASSAIIVAVRATAHGGVGGGHSDTDDDLNAARDRELGWDNWPGQIVDDDHSLRRWYVGDRAILLRVAKVPDKQCLPNPDEWVGAFDDLPGEYFVGRDRAMRRWWTSEGRFIWLKITVVGMQEAGQADKRPPLPEFPNVDPGVVDPLPPYTNKTPWLDPIYPRDFNGDLPN